jgi:formylglycine-generating enzyme required for sulfatase activity
MTGVRAQIQQRDLRVRYSQIRIGLNIMATSASDLTLYRYKCTNKGYVEDLGNDVTLTLMLIPSGEFMMGAPEEEPGSRDNERLLNDNYFGLFRAFGEVGRIRETAWFSSFWVL